MASRRHTVAAGLLLYSTLGLTLGSALAFALSRWLGLRLVRRIIPPATYEMLSVVARPHGVAMAFILFAVPGFPKDNLSRASIAAGSCNGSGGCPGPLSPIPAPRTTDRSCMRPRVSACVGSQFTSNDIASSRMPGN
jgi:hypothetical protein